MVVTQGPPPSSPPDPPPFPLAEPVAPLPSVSILGVRVHTITLATLLNYITAIIAKHQRALISYANIHGINLAYEIPWFRDFLNQSDMVICDGFGVKWGARILGYRIPERFTPPDWLGKLAERAAWHGHTLYLLGARPGVADRLATRFRTQYPKLRIVGTHHGFFDKQRTSAENQAVLAAINAVTPNILLVGFGMPLQEQWLRDNWADVQANVAITVGAAFDYLTGEVRRGPRWMTDHGLEWLARLVIEPRRLWRRYVFGNPLFLWRIMQQRFRTRDPTP